ncbi:Deoxyuridine 5'-triphosphate nucleotidohydrolase [Astathelohania contejeani]|uniref:Deoxyuridine 5'-triphosphate nucleotidohydrolase n=1 Tax=Astathelohania contejeani TaxID=164912 RepID=A0ABQ7HWT1_9MICR|nr:Deoxyuridine 5'-triphosphate nucleotidohydrolase [Thelohania contejeani]
MNLNKLKFRYKQIHLDNQRQFISLFRNQPALYNVIQMNYERERKVTYYEPNNFTLYFVTKWLLKILNIRIWNELELKLIQLAYFEDILTPRQLADWKPSNGQILPKMIESITEELPISPPSYLPIIDISELANFLWINLKIKQYFLQTHSHRLHVFDIYDQLCTHRHLFLQLPSLSRKVIETHDMSKYSVVLALGYTWREVHNFNYSYTNMAIQIHKLNENYHPQAWNNTPMSPECLLEALIHDLAHHWMAKYATKDKDLNVIDLKRLLHTFSASRNFNRFISEDVNYLKNLLKIIKDYFSQHHQPQYVLKYKKLTQYAFAPIAVKEKSEKNDRNYSTNIKFIHHNADKFNLYCPQNITIPALSSIKVFTDLQLYIPEDCHGRLVSISLPASSNIINPGHQKNVGVILTNMNSQNDFKLMRGACIAQLFCEKKCYPILVENVD